MQCLGLIMDGNRRWAKEQNLPTYEGHSRGGEVLRDCAIWVRDAHIQHAVFYAFSTENWNRSEAEVAYLMDLFHEWLQRLEVELMQSDHPVKIRFVGRRHDFSPELQAEMNRIELKNLELENAQTTIWLAMSYGGRAEIVAAVNDAIGRGDTVTEEALEQLLWTAELPDPDMIVRTSGEKRLSNFMAWRSVYSELHFIDTHWPALTKADFDDILKEYDKRNRRKGT